MEEILQSLKILNPSIDDKVLNIYLKMAIRAIFNYLNNDKFTDEDIVEKFPEAIIQIVSFASEIKSSGSGNVKSVTQGNRSITYRDSKSFTISDEVKLLLPRPYVRMY